MTRPARTRRARARLLLMPLETMSHSPVRMCLATGLRARLAPQIHSAFPPMRLRLPGPPLHARGPAVEADADVDVAVRFLPPVCYMLQNRVQ